VVAFGPTSVLVAEDDPDILTLVEVVLSRAGYQVLPVTDGAAALEIAFEQRPRVAILDVALPRLDGLLLLDRLRADSRTAAMPVVLLTAGAAGEQVEEGFRRGANRYVKKPFAIRELLSAVAELAGSATAPLPS